MPMYEWDWSKLVDVLGTLTAAWAGSWFAFRYNSNQEKTKRDASEKNSANLALFRLCRQYNVLALYVRDSLNPPRDSSTRELEINAFVPGLHEGDRVNQESLVFLIERGHTDLLTMILLEDDRFEAIMQNLYKRADYHVAHVQPAIERLGLPAFTPSALKKELGMRHALTMQSYTDNLYDQMDKSMLSLYECIDRFHGTMKSLYPKEKFVKVSPLSEIVPVKKTGESPSYRWK